MPDTSRDTDAGFLEIGRNDRFEIVINHPELKPDENGVGHIVFSIRQARNLALLLMKHADEAERDEWNATQRFGHLLDRRLNEG